MKIIYSLVITIALVGCATQKIEPTVLVKPVYKVATFPDALLEPCVVTPPPNMEYYISLDDIQKEDTLIRYSQSLLTDIEKCNSQLRQLNKINTEYRTLFSR